MIELAVGLFIMALLFGGRKSVTKTGEYLGESMENGARRIRDESRKL